MFEAYLPEQQAAEVRLLLQLVRPGFTPAAVTSPFLSSLEAPDWRFLVYASGRHCLLPLLYSHLRAAGLKARLPKDVGHVLKTAYLEIAGHNMRLTQRLMELLDFFKKHQVAAIPFKGPVLASRLYGDSALRQYQDLDILVVQKDAAKAWGLLPQAGYIPCKTRLTGAQFNHYARFENEIEFVSNDGQVVIDLHWKLSAHTRFPFDLDFCRQRLGQAVLMGRQVAVLSDEDTLLHLCVHGAGETWSNLEMVLCVAAFIYRCPALDWELVFRLAQDLRCERSLLLGLFLARDLFAVDLPGEAAERAEADGAIGQMAASVYSQMFAGKKRRKQGIKKRVADLPYQLRLRQGAADKLIYLLRRIFWPQRKDWRIFGAGRRFFWLLFVLRPLRQIVELGGKKVLREKG